MNHFKSSFMFGYMILLLALGGLLGCSAKEQAQPQPQPPEAAAEAQPPEAAAEAQPPVKRVNCRLPDGSFDITLDARNKVLRPPAEWIEADQWRQRYAKILEGTLAATSSQAASFYCYPFLDNSSQSVGLFCTYGWMDVFNAGLGRLTDARVQASVLPQDQGFFVPNPLSPKDQLSFDEFKTLALGDPAAKDARFILIGCYEDGATSKDLTLKISLLDRQGTQAIESLATQTQPIAGDFFQLAKQQREVAAQVCEQLIQDGVVAKRTVPDVQRMDFNVEMAGVSRLLASNDSWAMMDGIDRALQLSVIYPDKNIPLQAAAYGYYALGWTYFNYLRPVKSEYATLYMVKAYALAQWALQQDVKPILTQLVWLGTLKHFDYFIYGWLDDFTGEDKTKALAQLRPLREAVRSDPSYAFTQEDLEKQPMWLQLWRVSKMIWFVRQPCEATGLQNIGLGYKQTHDAFFEAYAETLCNFGYYNGPDERYFFSAIKEGAQETTRMNLAWALASHLALMEEGGLRQRLVQALEHEYQMAGLPFDNLRQAIENRDFYGMRELLLKELEMMAIGTDQSIFELDNSLASQMHAVTSPNQTRPEINQAPSGLVGFEFTPGRRLSFGMQRNFNGTKALLLFYGVYFGSYEDYRQMCEAYEKVDPTHWDYIEAYAQGYSHWIAEEGAVEEREKRLHESLRANSLQYTKLIELANHYLYTKKKDMARFYLHRYEHSDPFENSHWRELGDFYSKYGYRALGLKAYEKFLESQSNHYDVINECAWIRVQMGEPDSPQLRAEFDKGVTNLPGNGSYHRNRLYYLINVAKDYEAARQAAQVFAYNEPLEALSYLTEIEFKLGNKDACRALLERRQPDENTKGLALASFYVDKANDYMKYLDDLDAAAQMVDAAASVDDWKGDVIYVMADLALRKGDYDRAEFHYNRILERYGFSPGAYCGFARCLEKRGQIDKGIASMEAIIYGRDDEQFFNNANTCLMELYVKANRLADAQRLMQFIWDSPRHNRWGIEDVLEEYEKLDPQRAVELRAQMPALLAGPLEF